MNPSSNSPNSGSHGKRPMAPPFSSSVKSSSSSSPEDKAVADAECDLRRPNREALFGHMTRRPEREWRGIRPLAEGEGSSRQRAGKETSAAGAGEFSCVECGRVFRTSQELGGHRASHKGVMGCNAKAKKTTTCLRCRRQFATNLEKRIHMRRVHRSRHGCSVKAKETTVAAVAVVEAGGGGSGFVCRVCRRPFATYHGMRNHQRVHRGLQAEGGREGRGLMLDLNLPPPPELEEEEKEVDEEGRNQQGK